MSGLHLAKCTRPSDGHLWPRPAFDKSTASISEDPGTGKHYYLPGPHQGLYPKYPDTETKKLILTESIIDAATLYQNEVITKDYTVLACYGTNGFTAELEQAIKALQHLEEVILFFDGDEAGKEGVQKVSAKLQELRKVVTISQVNTPEGEDVNSLAQSHEKEIFIHLLNSRTVLSSSIEKKETPTTYERTQIRQQHRAISVDTPGRPERTA